MLGQTNDLRVERAENSQRFRFEKTDPSCNIARPGTDQHHPQGERRMSAAHFAIRESDRHRARRSPNR